MGRCKIYLVLVVEIVSSLYQSLIQFYSIFKSYDQTFYNFSQQSVLNIILIPIQFFL